jgi:hypothetical protein
LNRVSFSRKLDPPPPTEKMNMKHVLIAATILIGSLPAEAAAVKTMTYGCKSEADANKALMLQAKKDTSGLEGFTKPKIASGECIAFGRGVTVDPERTKAALTCARLTGGLDCYWMADYLIELHPSDQRQNPMGGGTRHRH